MPPSYTYKFIDSVKDGAIATWHQMAILPSLSIAQAILESGWGRSKLSKPPNNNLFGIKGHDWAPPNVVMMETSEWNSTSKSYYRINATFRKYPSLSDSITDHGMFVAKRPRYYRVLGVKNSTEACKEIQKAGYATSPTYADKLITLIRQYNLTQYDIGDPPIIESSLSRTKCNLKPGMNITLNKALAWNDVFAGSYKKELSGSFQIQEIVKGRASSVFLANEKVWVREDDCKC